MSEIKVLIDEINEKLSIDEVKLDHIINNLSNYTEESELELLFQLGDMLMSLGQIYDAEKIFVYLNNLGTHDDDIVSNLTDIYIVDNRLDDALSLINSSKKTVVTLMIKAEIFHQLNMADVSFNLLNEAKSMSDDIIIDFAIAELHFYEGNIIDAKESYEMVLKEAHEINGIHIHLRLAKLSLLQMEYEMALSHYEKVEESHYQNEDLFDKAVAASFNEQVEMAKSLLLKVIDNEPYRVQPYINLSDILEKENDYEEASKVIESYLIQDDKHAVMYSKLGELQFKQNKVAEALDSLHRSIEIDGAYQAAITRALEILLLSGNADQIDRFKAVIDFDELISDNIYLLAKIETENESYDDAHKLYQEAYIDLSDTVVFMTDYYYFLLEIASDDRYYVLEQLIQLEPDNIEWLHEKERLSHERD